VATIGAPPNVSAARLSDHTVPQRWSHRQSRQTGPEMLGFRGCAGSAVAFSTVDGLHLC